MQTTNITLDQLTPEQLKALATQMKAASSAKRKGAKDRWPIVDAMLAERDGNGFKHTTGDILVALQAKSLVDKDLSAEARAEALKMIQTRKQKLEKMVDEHGKRVHPEGKFGYKPSANGVGPLTYERVTHWILNTASDEDVKRLTTWLKGLKK